MSIPVLDDLNIAAETFSQQIDMQGYSLKNARLINSSGVPTGTFTSSPLAGDVYFDTAKNAIGYYTGTVWRYTNLNELIATGDVNVGGYKITSLTTPVTDTDAANKKYVDDRAMGLDAKASVLCATTTNVGRTTLAAVDGITPIDGDRILVKSQANPAQNGIYIAHSGPWTRATDMDNWAEVPSAYVWVEKGLTLADTGWLCTSDNPGVIDSTAIDWVQFASAGIITATMPILKTGNNLTLELNTDPGLQLTTNKLEVKPNGAAGVQKNSSGVGVKVDGTTISFDGSGNLKTIAGSVARIVSVTTHSLGTSITATHNLANQYHHTQVFISTTGQEVLCGVTKGADSDVFTFKASQAANTLTFVFIG